MLPQTRLYEVLMLQEVMVKISFYSIFSKMWNLTRLSHTKRKEKHG